MSGSAPATFEAYFTRSRLKSDTLLWAFSCAVVLLQRLFTIATLATTAYATPPTASRSQPPPPARAVPHASCILHAAADADAGDPRNDLLTILLCYGSWEYGSRLMHTVCIAGPCLLLAHCLAPSWYHRGGRTLLVCTVRVAPRMLVLLELAHLLQHDATHAWLRICFLSPHGLLSTAFLAVLLPVPLVAHSVVAILEACLFAAAVVSSLYGPLPLPSVVPLVVQYATVCVLLPSTLLAASEQWIRSSYRHPPLPLPLPPPPAPAPAPAPAAADPDTPPAHKTPASPDLRTAHATTTPAGSCCSMHALPCQACHGQAPAACHAAAPAAAPASPPPMAPRPVYTPKLRVRLASIKIHHHDAFQHRHQIGAAVEAVLLACPELVYPPGSCPRAPVRPPLGVRTIAVEGCLQLLVTVMDFPDDAPPSSGGSEPTPPPAFSISRDALQRHVEACLPDWAHGTLVSVDILPGSSAPGVAARGASVQPLDDHHNQHQEHAAGRQLADLSLQLEPLCVAAGEQHSQPLVARLPAGGSLSLAAAPGEVAGVVVACSYNGDEVVTCNLLAEADCLSGGFRVHLPPNLDPGPISIHLLAPPPAAPGTLLGTASTMALPPAPCTELLALPLHDADAQESVAALLHDLAATLALMQTRGAACLPALRPTADDMLDFFYAAGLSSCTAFLHRCLASAANQRTPPVPAPAAARGTGGASYAPSRAAAAAPRPWAGALRAVAAAVVGPAVRLEAEEEARYTAWRTHAGRAEDVRAVAVCALCCVAHVVKVVLLGSLVRDGVPLMLGWAGAQLACIALPVLTLAWGPDSVRARRGAAVAVQFALRGASYLAAAQCWLVNPKMSQASIEPLPTALLGFGILLPALSRVHWTIQLAVGLLLEELPRYAMLQSPACPSDPTPPGQLHTAGSLLQVALVPLVAAACSWVMERRSRASFLRLAPAARSAGSSRTKGD